MRWEGHVARIQKTRWSKNLKRWCLAPVGFCEHGNGPCIHSKVWNFSKTQGVAKASSSSLQHPDCQNATQLSTSEQQACSHPNDVTGYPSSWSPYNDETRFMTTSFMTSSQHHCHWRPVTGHQRSTNCNSLGDNKNALCIKAFGFLPGVIFWSQTNVSGLLVCPIFRVSR